MTLPEIREYCKLVYSEVYNRVERATYSETLAQKEAIMFAIISGMKNFPNTESAEIWRAVYETHVHRKSGIDDAEVIARVISADQSWKKSSGHAFEEMIKTLGNHILNPRGIEILLQRDLHEFINGGRINNDPRDLYWLMAQIQASAFDLYATVRIDDGRTFCYGCIQSKTSIRDRVTREREPSLNAMGNFFWSAAVVLDGDFLRLPKFKSMVNGGTPAYPENGWHGMYVFSEQYSDDRIYSTNLNLKNFAEHAVAAANYWLNQRQWLDKNWRAS